MMPRPITRSLRAYLQAILRRCSAGGNPLDLAEVIDVMPPHGFDNGLECHVAAFGMSHGLVESFGWKAAYQEDIPIAYSFEGRKRSLGGVRRIRFCPVVLVKWLDHVMRFGQRLPDAVGKDQFAIGQVAEDLPNTPLSR